MQKGFFKQFILICQFEIKRGFTTQKGLLVLVTFGIVWSVILLYPICFAAELVRQEKGWVQDFSFFEFFGLGAIHQWPIPEFGVLWQLALILFPMLSITLAADQTCSDRERGTLRFIVLRSSRDSIFFGRFAGVLVIQTLLICVATISTFILVSLRQVELIFSALPSLLAITINLILVILPFTAMMAILSVKVKSARQATIWAILIWTFLAGIISGFAEYLPMLSYFKILVPGYQLSDLAQLSGWQTLQLSYIPILQGFFLLMLGRWIMVRQAL
jgi:ABC-type Na+ efflux pump permease subunit